MSRPITVFEPPSFWRIRPAAALARLLQSGDLFITLSLHRITVRYEQSRLGILWAFLQPLAMMLVFTLMFTILAVRPSGDVPFPLFVYSALIPWTMFSGGVTSASGALRGHATLLTKVYFPREILPLTYVVAALCDMLIASVVLVALMWWFSVSLTATALWAVVAIALLTGLLVGLGLLLSAIQIRFRDVALAMPVLVQIWFFASPILYTLSAAKAALPAPIYNLYVLNPMAGIVDTFRRSVVLQQAPDMYALGVAFAVVFVLVPAAYVYFKWVELTMADVV